MESVLSDDVLRDRLVAEASEHVLRFDWGDVARRTAEVYADMVAAGGPNFNCALTRGCEVPLRVVQPGVRSLWELLP
jgi:hypothetical protein